jgi:putative DNA primase/helicase
MTDLDVLHAALVSRATAIAIALLGEPNRAMSSKRELRFGRRGSASVVISGAKAGSWFDHETGTGGDLLALVIRERGGGFRDAVEFAEEFIGMAPREFVPIGKPQRPPARPKEGRDAMDGTHRALDLWREAVPISGTIVERYLASRGIIDLAPGIDGSVLRFHRSCPYGEGRHPCLLERLTERLNR